MQATNLKQYVLEFINAVRRRPALATDPNELDNLEGAALTSFQGAFSATHAPIAPMSWEARTLFLSTVGRSERIQLDIPFPCMLVGAFPSVEPVGAAGGLIVPTTQSIDVSLDLNNHEYLTQAQGTTTVVVGAQQERDIPFCTFASLGVNGGQRLLAWVVPYRTAQLGITFRWKQGPNVYQTSHVGLVLYARALQES